MYYAIISIYYNMFNVFRHIKLKREIIMCKGKFF